MIELPPRAPGVLSGGLALRAFRTWLNRHKFVSGNYQPSVEDLARLHGKPHFWYSFPTLTLASRETQETRVTVSTAFYLLAIFGQATQIVASTGSFRAQVFDDGAKYKLQDRGENQANLVGTAQDPGSWLRKPYFVAPNSPILCVVQNMTAVANTVNVALYGVTES